MVTCTQNVTLSAGLSQAELNTAYTNWLASVSATGGCGTSISNNSTSTPSCGQTRNITWTIRSTCGANQTCNATFTVGACGGPICTYTQGYYGNKNGNSCDADGTSGTPVPYQSPVLLMTQLLSTPLIVGVGDTSIFIPSGVAGATKVNSVMPGGSSPKELTNNSPCDITNACFNTYLNNRGKINNVLLSQTITLSLNLRISASLPDFVLQEGVMATVRAVGGCGGTVPEAHTCVYDPITHVLVSDNYTYRTITAAVVNAIDGPKTVFGLRDLANAALANVDGIFGSERDVSLSAINAAVDAINNAFDQCRIFIGWDVIPCSQTDHNLIANARGTAQPVTNSNNRDVEKVSEIVTVQTFPNPYTDNVTFKMESNVSGKAVLEVYNLMGQKVKTLFEGNIIPGKSQTIQYKVPTQNRTSLVYRLTIGDKTTTGKVLYIN
ncbi:MAG: hypothetical protein ABIP80_06915 [Ferruginibacter sp.]